MLGSTASRVKALGHRILVAAHRVSSHRPLMDRSVLLSRYSRMVTGGIRGLLRHRWVQRAWWPILALTIALATWHIDDLVPVAGLDPSWIAALYLAQRDGLVHGWDIVFSHGPAGFVNLPRLYFPAMALVSLTFTLASHAALVLTVMLAARRSTPRWLVALLGLVVGSVAKLLVASQALVLLALVGALFALRPSTSPAGARRMMGALGIVAGTVVLIKFNDGAAIAALGGVTALMLAAPRRDHRPLTWFIAGLLAAVGVGWVLLGQPLVAIPDFFARSIEVASGYSVAMGLEEDVRVWEHGAALTLVAGIIVATAVLTRGWTRIGQVGALTLSALFMWFALKHGFVRHDGHAVGFFAMTSLAAAVLVALSRRPAVAGVGLAFGLISLIWSSGIRPDVLDLPSRVEWNRHQLAMLLVHERREPTLALARQGMRQGYALEAEALSLLDGRSVHVDPWAVDLVWAYQGTIDWKPLPTLQSYATFTEELDNLSARAIRDEASAPETILRAQPAAIDGRNPAWEPPRTTLAIVCQYREEANFAQWQVLRRGGDVCGEPREIGRVTARYGEAVTIPPLPRDQIAFMRIHGVETAVGARLRSFLYRAPRYFVSIGDAVFRLVPDHAEGPLLLHLPGSVAPTPPFGPVMRESTTVTISVEEAFATNDTVEISFHAMPVITEDAATSLGRTPDRVRRDHFLGEP